MIKKIALAVSAMAALAALSFAQAQNPADAMRGAVQDNTLTPTIDKPVPVYEGNNPNPVKWEMWRFRLSTENGEYKYVADKKLGDYVIPKVAPVEPPKTSPALPMQAPASQQDGRGELTLPVLTVPVTKPPLQLPQGVDPVNSFAYMKPTDPNLVAARNRFFDKIKELEDARKLYVESGRPLPDGFFTMHTSRDGWRINFLRTAANLYVSRQPRAVSPVLPPSPARDFLQQIQSGPAAMPVAPVPSTGGLGSASGGGGSVMPDGSFMGSVNDWIAQNPILGGSNLSFYGEISLYKTYSSDIMLPAWVDGKAGFVFNFNALSGVVVTANGQRQGRVVTGVPGTDLAMVFETKTQPPLNAPYTYVLFYRLVRIGDEIVKQKITYEQFMEYGEKRGYWEQGWAGWNLNPNDAWKEGK